MTDWTQYSDDLLSICLPRHLRRLTAKRWNTTPFVRMFKGRIMADDPHTIVHVVVEGRSGPAVSWNVATAELVDDVYGSRTHIHYAGKSVLRAGGFERRATTTTPVGTAHRWEMDLPDQGHWLYVDIFTGPGPLTWAMFEATARRIVESLEVHMAPGES